VTVSGANVITAVSECINSTTTTVIAGNVLSNAGRIEGDTVQITSPTTLNTGTVIGDNVLDQSLGQHRGQWRHQYSPQSGQQHAHKHRHGGGPPQRRP